MADEHAPQGHADRLSAGLQGFYDGLPEDQRLLMAELLTRAATGPEVGGFAAPLVAVQITGVSGVGTPGSTLTIPLDRAGVEEDILPPVARGDEAEAAIVPDAPDCPLGHVPSSPRWALRPGTRAS